jgi:hypothetical protein
MDVLGMSARQVILESFSKLDDDASTSAVVEAIRGVINLESISIALSDWQGIVAYNFRDDLDDTTQDIYTLDDGAPLE